MSLLHFRHRRRLTLLAAEALGGAEREEALAHVAACPGCGRELAEIRELLSRFASDPARSAEMPIPPEAVTALVLARLDATIASRAWILGSTWILTPAIAAAAVLAVLAFLSRWPLRVEAPAPAVTVSEDALRRIEGTVAREQAVRYLNEAQDVLVTVAAAPRACHRESQRVDVGEEARRSRELLARRALLVDLGEGALPSTAPLIRDVEQMLREVALLESCARARDLEAIHKEIGRRNLLMKIDLMTRELQG
jgi:hypothetical protein